MTDTRTLHVERSTSTAHRLHHYDGVCGNVHGHNMKWEAEVEVSMEEVGDDNMPLDLKDVSSLIDDTDHAILLNVNDKLLDALADEVLLDESQSLEQMRQKDQSGIYVDSGQIPLLGEAYLFHGDPTCEVMAQWMADRIQNIDAVVDVEIIVYETDKYGIETSSWG